MGKLSAEKWSQYWRHDTITTLGDMFTNNYDLSIADFWNQELKGDFESVIDLACGNGALVWLANEILNKNGDVTSITGVDVADIDPFQVLNRDRKEFPRVRFIGNTSIEDLPFEDGTINVAISQYGLEYSNLEKTIAEISRVLKPSGKMCFIIHDENSAILKLSTLYMEQYKTVLNDIKIHEKFLELDSLVGGATDMRKISGKPKIRKKRAEIDGLSNQIKLIMKEVNNPSVLERYLAPMYEAFSTDALQRKVNRKKRVLSAKESLVEYIGRIEDLSSAALSESELKSLLLLIENEGFTNSENRNLEYKEHNNMGTILVAQRSHA